MSSASGGFPRMFHRRTSAAADLPRDVLTVRRRRSRYVWMDVLRGFAIFLVILEHAADTVTLNGAGALPGVTQFNEVMGPFRMPALMFLSGMLLLRSLQKPPSEFTLGKIGRIGWPYLVWSAAILGLLAATSAVAGNEPVTPATVIRVFYDPPTYLWYLAYLLVFYFVSLVLPPRARTVAIPVALVASQVVAADDAWQRLLFLFAFFLLGDLVNRSGHLFERAVRSTPVLIAAAVAAVATAIFAGLRFPVRYESTWFVGAAAGVLVLGKLAILAQSSLGGRWMARYGRLTIVFYTTHWIAVAVVFHGLRRLGVSDGGLLFASALAAGLAIGFAFAWLQSVWKPARYLFELPLARWFGRTV